MTGPGALRHQAIISGICRYGTTHSAIRPRRACLLAISVNAARHFVAAYRLYREMKEVDRGGRG